MIVNDFIDEFYAFDINNWADSLEKILLMLNFPLQVEYTCEWKEFLYERSGRLQYFEIDDRKLMAECQEIAMFKMGGRFRRLRLLSVHLTGNSRYRNEKAYEIYRIFRKVYGRHIFFVVCNDRDIAFMGTSVDKYKRSEVIISDWFGEKTDRDIMSRIMEIDFSLFSFDSLGKLYSDYLWAIARPYIKYYESKMYLIYGVDYIETYESVIQDPEGNGLIPVTKIDQEETLLINSTYYSELYGDDYFIDDILAEEDSLYILEEDDVELEWTLLEMDLANEAIDIETEEYNEKSYNKDYGHISDEVRETIDISGMNPEEMLNYIRNS